MGRLLSVVLLAALGLPFFAPLLALGASSDASLPACCRRNGKHECMVSMAERASFAGKGAQFKAPVEKCPYCPQAITSAHVHAVTFSTLNGKIPTPQSHQKGVAQAESTWRMARERSRQKRGPPSVSESTYTA